MKKIASLILVATLASATTTIAQSGFDGVITYDVSADGGANPQAAQMMQGATFQIFFSHSTNRTKSIMKFAMGTQTSIINGDTIVSLMDMGPRKMESKMAKSDLKKYNHQTQDPDIKYTDETKQIAGYACKKAVITTTGKDGQPQTVDVYYTDQLPSYEGKDGEYKGLKGFPLEFTSINRGMTIKFSASSVKKQALSDDTFAIPDGYQMMPAGGPMGPGGRGGMGGM
jgi:GLPGLI family protein